MTRTVSCVRRRCLRDQRDERVEIDRFYHVMIEARCQRPTPVLFLPVTGDGDDHRILTANILAQQSSHLVTVHSRKPDIQKHEFGPERPGNRNG